MQMKSKLCGIFSALLMASANLAHAELFSPCDPCASMLSGLYIGAEALYWTACVKDLDIANSEIDPPVVEGGVSTTVAKIESADFNWKFGYRVYAGYHNFCSDWDIEGIYTHWDHTAHNHNIPSILVDTFPKALANSGAIKHRLTYNNVDALLSRSYCWCPGTTFRPFIGFRGFWIDQHAHFSLNNAFIDDHTLEGDVPVSVLDSKLWAPGIEIGTEYQWDVWCGFEVHGGGSVALLQARTNDVYKQVTGAHLSGENIIIDEIKLKNKRCLPIQAFDIYAGLGYDWEYDMYGCCSKFHFYADYEFSYFAHLPSLPKDPFNGVLVSNHTYSTLILQGITFGASVIF